MTAMSKLRRYHTPGNWYFITSVTYQRMPILVEHAELVKFTLETANARHEFKLHAWTILPDHIHLILDSQTGDLSAMMKSFKTGFASYWRSRQGVRSGRVWQNRFWDHIIRDDADLNAHVDYIHYNPVKHGLVSSPFDWQHSSIHQFHRDGLYDLDWGKREPDRANVDFGE